MKSRRKPPTESAAVRELRDQEVLRANRELAAYFKGLRTEREARAALKTIKAFVRDREKQDEGSRLPLPGVRAANAPGATRDGTRPPHRPRRAKRALPADVSPPSVPENEI